MTAELLHRRMTKAADGVIVHHPDGLQVGIDDRRTNEREAALLQVKADRVGELGARRHVTVCGKTILDGSASGELPLVAREATKFCLNCSKSARILDRGGQLCAVPDNAGVAEQTFDAAS